MKYHSKINANDFPDAPLAMPKQKLEHSLRLFPSLRNILNLLPWF